MYVMLSGLNKKNEVVLSCVTHLLCWKTAHMLSKTFPGQTGGLKIVSCVAASGHLAKLKSGRCRRREERGRAGRLRTY